MSFSADVEHIWMSVADLPESLRGYFPKGVCTVFTDEQFTAAIPATNEEALELADLLEIAAIGIALNDAALVEYRKRRDELCEPHGLQLLSLAFRTEMEKVKDREEADNSKYLGLASRARPQFNGH